MDKVTLKNAIADHVEVLHQYSTNENTDKITFGIKPEAGSVIIFPSSAPYHHTAHLIKSGYKYMVPNHWLHGETPVEDEMPDAM